MPETDMGVIALNGMLFFARHGVYERERAEGNHFIVDLRVEADLEKASGSDSLDDTVDYQMLYSIVRQEMEIPSSLMEHVAGRIIRRIRNEIPGVISASVTITKKNPPLGGAVSSSSVTLSY